MAKSKLHPCKSCGAHIAKNAKVCPHCGAKNKKPIFTRAWFWIIVILIAAGLSAPKNEVSTTQKDTPAVATAQAEHTAETANTAAETIAVENTEAPTEDQMTTGQKNALKSANNYLSFSAFSYNGLIKQLEFEQYTHDDAVFAADHCDADWYAQALKSAKNYLSFSAFSHDGLSAQLEFEGFTSEEAAYGADNCGADWNEQAAKSAANYLSFSSFSKDGLIQQLEFEKFTHEQAVYGAEQNGY